MRAKSDNKTRNFRDQRASDCDNFMMSSPKEGYASERYVAENWLETKADEQTRNAGGWSLFRVHPASCSLHT